MHGKQVAAVLPCDRAPTIARDTSGAPQQRPRRRGTEADDQLRIDEPYFTIQPGLAGAHLGVVRRGMQARLAATVELEVLHGVGEVETVALESRIREGTVEQLPGRPDERPAREVLVIARLLADEHDARIAGPFPEYGLRGRLPERTVAAGLCLERQTLDRGGRRTRDRSGVLGIRACRARPATQRVLLAGLALHVGHAPVGVPDQRRDQVRLGHVLPVFLRHFRLHRPNLDARGIEYAAVVDPPGVFEGIAPGCCAFIDRRRKPDFAGTLPVGTAHRRENGPAHIGKAAFEEAAGVLDDAVLRLEPGHVPRLAVLAVGLGHRAKSHESLHLVYVPAHRLGVAREPCHVRIAAELHQVTLAVGNPPEHRIQERPAIRAAMTAGRPCHVQESLGNTWRRRGLGRWRHGRSFTVGFPPNVLRRRLVR